MTDMDVRTFAECLTIVAELFGAELSEAKLALYFEALSDLPLDVVRQGLGVATKTCTFMPKPSEIRSFVCADDEDTTEAAWMLWKSAARKVGGYSSILTDDPALGETLTRLFGGWPQACRAELSPEMWSSKRKEFGRVYRVMAHRGLSGPRYLAGIVEVENARFPERSHPLAMLTENGLVCVLEGDEIQQAKLDAASSQPGRLSA